MTKIRNRGSKRKNSKRYKRLFFNKEFIDEISRYLVVNLFDKNCENNGQASLCKVGITKLSGDKKNVRLGFFEIRGKVQP